jgi:hypothetical protein
MKDRVTNGLPFIFVYLDDISVGSPDLASNLQHLWLLFQRLCQFGLVINNKKQEGRHPAGAFPAADGAGFAGFPRQCKFLPSFPTGGGQPAEASHRCPSWRGQSQGQGPLVCRDGGRLHQHQGGPCQRRPAHPPHPRSGDLPHGGRLCEPHGSGPTAAALTLFKLAAIGIFFKKIKSHTAALLRL